MDGHLPDTPIPSLEEAKIPEENYFSQGPRVGGDPETRTQVSGLPIVDISKYYIQVPWESISLTFIRCVAQGKFPHLLNYTVTLSRT